MIEVKKPLFLFFAVTATALIFRIEPASLLGQQSTPPAQGSNSPGQPLSMSWTAEQDHQNMMDQLGIKALRPGLSGNENAPNHANTDEALANPFPTLPGV